MGVTEDIPGQRGGYAGPFLKVFVNPFLPALRILRNTAYFMANRSYKLFYLTGLPSQSALAMRGRPANWKSPDF